MKIIYYDMQILRRKDGWLRIRLKRLLIDEKEEDNLWKIQKFPS